jgi:hypothetical protein
MPGEGEKARRGVLAGSITVFCEGLIAYQKPLYQLLSLEGEPQERAKAGAAEEQTQTQLSTGTAPRASELSLKAMVERLLEQQRASGPKGV